MAEPLTWPHRGRYFLRSKCDRYSLTLGVVAGEQILLASYRAKPKAPDKILGRVADVKSGKALCNQHRNDLEKNQCPTPQ